MNTSQPLLFSIASICLITFILQCVHLSKYKEQHSAKEWASFLGFTIGAYFLALISYIFMAIQALDLGGAILAIMACGGIVGINTIILIVGLVTKALMKKQSKNTKIQKTAGTFDKRTAGLTVGGYILACILILAIIPQLFLGGTTLKGQNYVLNYLNQKYGDQDFKVVNITDSYSHNGMWDKSVGGYNYLMQSSAMDDTFYVVLDDSFEYIEADYFLPTYYSSINHLEYSAAPDSVYNVVYGNYQDLSSYFKQQIEQKYSIAFGPNDDLPEYYSYFVSGWSSTDGPHFRDSYYVVPPDYGKIPSTDEMTTLLYESYIKTNH